MTSDEILDGVVAWARATCTDLQGGYNYAPTSKTEALPDVVAEVTTIETAVSSPEFPMRNIQQRWIVIYRLELSFMVENSDPEAAAAQLRGFQEELQAALMSDGTLGGRVPFISPLFTFDFTPPFVEYEDGTRGREMTLTMAVGQLVEVE